MMKGMRFSMNTMTTVVMGLALAACGSDDLFTEQDAINHANKVLGINIPADQEWNLASQVTAEILIDKDYGETYTIKVYSNDPLTEEYGTVLTEGTVENGQTLVRQFECASSDKRLFLGVTNSRGYTFYRTAPVVDGKLSLTIGSGSEAASRGMQKSPTTPNIPDITIPDDAYAKSFLEGAKEPTDANTTDNHNDGGGTAVWWGWIGDAQILQYNPGGFTGSEEDRTLFETYCRPYTLYAWNQAPNYFGRTGAEATQYLYQILSEAGKWSSWVNGVTPSIDETYVTKFKITGYYDKGIDVLSTEAGQGDPRSVYISGKWTVASPNYSGEQRVGGGAVIVVDDGGELNIPEGMTMTFVNQARLVVMPGGKITGGGKLVVTNGNADGLEGYNGGTIEIGTFNNNGGTFHNYGTFTCTNLMGGAQKSSIYNHAVVHITRSGKAESWGGNYDTPNMRIYNACHWYCDEDMRAYIVEVAQGSYFRVGGELFMSTGYDGTNDDSYVALGTASLMDIGTLRNNETNWIGPKNGYAIVELGGITYLNWSGDEPIKKGYFINNIAMSIDDTTMGAGQAHGADAYVAMRDFILNGYGMSNDYFSPIGKTANPDGNGSAVLVEKGSADIDIYGDDDYEAGKCGCTPGYESAIPHLKKVKPAVWSYAFEDSPRADYDMNDVVLKVSYHRENDFKIDTTKLDITLCCTGASLGLFVHLGDRGKIFGGQEVHAAMSGTSGMFINTGTGTKFENREPITVQIATPEDFNFSTADFWIDASGRSVHISTIGQDPHAVIIPADWRWPKEWTSIKEAYPDFVNFANDPENPAYAEWYKNPVEEHLYSE